MRVIVTGPRDWTDTNIVQIAFDDVWELAENSNPFPQVLIVHGGADGLDKLCEAEAWRREWQTQELRPKYGIYPPKIAPLKRNQEMVDIGADLALVFLMPCEKKNCRRKGMHFTHGTSDCLDRIKAADMWHWKYYA